MKLYDYNYNEIEKYITKIQHKIPVSLDMGSNILNTKSVSV